MEEKCYLFGVQINLSHAHMIYAKLNYADLHWADMTDTNLYQADLHGAKLLDAKINNNAAMTFVPMACPDSGSFIGWKKASGKIVKLRTPADAKRTSASKRKCRCNKAKVVSITEINGDPCALRSVASDFDRDFVYTVGETVSVNNFCEDRWDECSSGIHFFINREEAVQYTW